MRERRKEREERRDAAVGREVRNAELRRKPGLGSHQRKIERESESSLN